MIAWRPALEEAAPPPGLPPLADRSSRRNTARALLELPVLLVLAGVIAFLLKTFLAQAFYIPSESMLPQLEVNDRVVVSKLSYRLHDARRGDIVVFDDPHGRSRDEPGLIGTVLEGVGLRQPSTDEYIKRVVALPGETIEGREGRVYVDGRLLDEPYLPPGTATAPFPATTVGEGELFVLGDNRANSSDSRQFGAIPVDSVVGRAVLKVWPLTDASFL